MHVIRKICHRVAVMEGGQIVEQGPVLEVFKNPTAQITKRFVQQVTEPEETKETIEHLLERYPEGKVIQLSFVGDDAESPLITKLIRNFEFRSKYCSRENFANEKWFIWNIVYSYRWKQ